MTIKVDFQTQEPNAPDLDPATRYRMFEAKKTVDNNGNFYVLIRDLRHNKRKRIDSVSGTAMEQATVYLRQVCGISVDALGLAHEDKLCTLLSLDIATPLK